jgi:hypothetical protein
MAKQAAARLQAASDPPSADEGNHGATKEIPRPPAYAHPWPDAIPGLGPRGIGPFESCIGCGRGSWARYGTLVLCCPCAIAKLGSTPWP